MSSLASAPRRAVPGARERARRSRALALLSSSDVRAGVPLAAALTALAFLAGGGADLAGETWVEAGLVVLGCLVALAWMRLRVPGARAGARALAAFAALAVLTAVSTTWSVRPDTSWLEADRTLAYLAAFGSAVVAARLWPARWRALVGAVALVATALSGYALLAKVFPAALDAVDPIGRLRAPFDYWNATGLIGAMALPAILWAGARRDGGGILRGLAAPAGAVLISVVVLSYSRSALLAALVAVAVWFSVVPLRLRGAFVLTAAGAGGAAITGWALRTHALTHDRIPLTARVDAGHGFGVVMLLVLLLVAAVGTAGAFCADRTSLAPALRRRVGAALVTLVALIPLVGLGVLATSSRGLGGSLSHAWRSLTEVGGGAGNAPGRLVELGNSRPRYWGDGLKIGEHSPLHGVGAGGYATARPRYDRDFRRAEHAHSYLVQTFADLGALGLAANLALFVAWTLSVRRTLGGVRSREGEPPGAASDERLEHGGLLSLLCVVVAFGVHSAIDWTWSIPGTAVPALICAGWLAGRGPLIRITARLARPRRLRDQPGLAAGTALVAAAGLLAAGTVWQPLRAADADTAATGALARGELDRAAADARAAASANPLSPEPHWTLASALSAAGQLPAARAQLVNATTLQPQNPAVWQQLGFFDLAHGQPVRATVALRRALTLEPADPATQAALQQARRQAPASSP